MTGHKFVVGRFFGMILEVPASLVGENIGTCPIKAR